MLDNKRYDYTCNKKVGIQSSILVDFQKKINIFNTTKWNWCCLVSEAERLTQFYKLR